MKRMIQQRNSVRLSMCYDNISFTREQLALLEDRDQTIGDLQFSLDEKDAQLEEVRGREGGRERKRGEGDLFGQYIDAIIMSSICTCTCILP